MSSRPEVLGVIPPPSCPPPQHPCYYLPQTAPQLIPHRSWSVNTPLGGLTYSTAFLRVPIGIRLLPLTVVASWMTPVLASLPLSIPYSPLASSVPADEWLHSCPCLGCASRGTRREPKIRASSMFFQSTRHTIII